MDYGLLIIIDEQARDAQVRVSGFDIDVPMHYCSMSISRKYYGTRSGATV